MDLTSALWLFPILFMAHNFEEMIMLQRWWQHNHHKPVKSPFTRLAEYPQETVAALIALIFFLFSFITIASIISNHLLIGLGLALAFGFQLVGHVVEFLRIRRYMPHIVTAIATLPYYPWLFMKALDEGYSITSLALSTLCMGIFGLIVLWSAHKMSKRISQWLQA